MPTKKRREKIIPDNLPAETKPEEFCPAVYTGQKLHDTDPSRYGRVVQQLAEGKPLTRIVRENKVSADTVAAILKREKETIDAVQEMTKGLTTYAAQTALMRLVEKLDKDEVPVGLLPVTVGILRDHERKDQGAATQLIEVRKTVSLADVKAELEAMKRDAVEVEAEVVES